MCHPLDAKRIAWRGERTAVFTGSANVVLGVDDPLCVVCKQGGRIVVLEQLCGFSEMNGDVG